MVVPEAHANVAESSRNCKRGRGNGKWKGKEVTCSKAKERKNPRVGSNPRRKEVTIAGKSEANAIDAEQRGIGPVIATPPNTSLTFTNRARTKGKVNMSPTSSLSLKLSLKSTTTQPSVQVEASRWMKVRTAFLMTLTYLGTCSNLQEYQAS
jgi:hypothetical protein